MSEKSWWCDDCGEVHTEPQVRRVRVSATALTVYVVIATVVFIAGLISVAGWLWANPRVFLGFGVVISLALYLAKLRDEDAS